MLLLINEKAALEAKLLLLFSTLLHINYHFILRVDYQLPFQWLYSRHFICLRTFDDIIEYLVIIWLLITSGAIQLTVPLRKFIFWFLDIWFEHPKSKSINISLPVSLHIPLLSTKILAPLISLWITLWAWRYSSPASICLV